MEEDKNKTPNDEDDIDKYWLQLETPAERRWAGLQNTYYQSSIVLQAVIQSACEYPNNPLKVKINTETTLISLVFEQIEMRSGTEKIEEDENQGYWEKLETPGDRRCWVVLITA